MKIPPQMERKKYASISQTAKATIPPYPNGKKLCTLVQRF